MPTTIRQVTIAREPSPINTLKADDGDASTTTTTSTTNDHASSSSSPSSSPSASPSSLASSSVAASSTASLSNGDADQGCCHRNKSSDAMLASSPPLSKQIAQIEQVKALKSTAASDHITIAAHQLNLKPAAAECSQSNKNAAANMVNKYAGTKAAPEQQHEFEVQYVWRNIIFFIVMHLCIPLAFIDGIRRDRYILIPWHAFLGYMAGLGVTAGAHRLWCHRSYKAHWSVRLFLAFWFTMAGQNDIYEWCRDHRVHHKFSETDADPHNSNRGFFFAHMGWLCCRKHPNVIKKGKQIGLDDLLQDPIVRFNKKYYYYLHPIVVFLIPTMVTSYLFGETYLMAFVQSMVRYCFSLHVTWLVNSAAHLWGNRPYNEKIEPRESPFVIWVNVLGEGFHNFHHTFPFDYRCSEFGWLFQFNATCLFIDTLAYLGLVWDCRTANDASILSAKARVLNSHHEHHHEHHD